MDCRSFLQTRAACAWEADLCQYALFVAKIFPILSVWLFSVCFRHAQCRIGSNAPRRFFLRMFSQALDNSRPRHPEILADLPRHALPDLRVAGYRGAPCGLPVDIHRVTAAFPEKLAAVVLEMLEQSLSLHAPMGSRTTSRPSNSCRVSSLLASRTSATASLRLSRASSRVFSWALAPGSSST